MKHGAFWRSVATMTAGSLAAKAIGALYRIPLTGLLGSYGMGLYQLAYPLFCLTLTFSSAGVPAAFARIVAADTARGEEDGRAVKRAMLLFAGLGALGTLFLCLFAHGMARLQGDGALVRCYLALAPAVVPVAVISVLRGYFQGKNNMLPTAISELVEQAVKAGMGLFFAYRYRTSPALAVALCLAGVTCSEAVALGFLYLRFRREKHAPPQQTTRRYREIFRSVLPVMVSCALLPLSETLDSVLIVRLLAPHSDRAVALYGLFAGGASALISLPASLSYGLAAAAVPAVAAATARGEHEEGRRRALYALLPALLFSAACAIGLFFFAGTIVKLLYPALSRGDGALLLRLIRTMSLSAVFLAGTGTLASCLAGMGRAKKAARAMFFVVVLKHLLEVLLIGRMGILGAAIAANVCYLVAFFLDLFYTVRKEKEKAHDHGRKSRDGAGRLDASGEEGPSGGGRGAPSHRRNSLGTDAG